MATATERAAVGAEEARMEGKGKGGQAVEAAMNVRTGRDEPGMMAPGQNNGVGMGHNDTTVGDRGLLDHHHRDRDHHHGVGVGRNDTTVGDRDLLDHHHRDRDHHHHGTGAGLHGGEYLGNTEGEMARLRLKTHITHEGDAYCPNPNIRDLPREFETRVQVIQRYPEMKSVEKTDFIKEIHHEERTIIVQRTRVIHDDIERIDRVPVVRQVPRNRIEIHYRTVSEEREITDMVQEVDYVDIPRIEMVPRVITEDVEERIVVPVVREVPVTRMVEVPTGNYCEAPAGTFVAAGDFDLLKQGHGHRHGQKHTSAAAGAGVIGGLLHKSKSSSSSSSSSSSDNEGIGHKTNAVQNADGTVTPAGKARRKKSLLQRVLHQ